VGLDAEFFVVVLEVLDVGGLGIEGLLLLLLTRLRYL